MFDITQTALGWFDETANPLGWFDPDLIAEPSTPAAPQEFNALLLAGD